MQDIRATEKDKIKVGDCFRGGDVIKGLVVRTRSVCPDRCLAYSWTDFTHVTFRFDYLATKVRAIIVPSCGIDSVPADVCVYPVVRTEANRDDGHPDTVVQNTGCKYVLYLYVSALIMSVRKKAGAVHMESNGGSGTAGMTEALRR
jgi:hypothetical protein